MLERWRTSSEPADRRRWLALIALGIAVAAVLSILVWRTVFPDLPCTAFDTDGIETVCEPGHVTDGPVP